MQIAAGLLVGASVVAMASAALAQAPAAGQVEEVVVTGSRVIQNGNNMPTPVTVLQTQQLTTTVPSNLQEGLITLPVFAGAQSGPQRQPGNSGGNSAAHTLNLRNIGTTRTLVLFDGRRVPPTSPTGEVNADLVPSMLLQRIDIVTGGASAVYGSDAVAGVVNFITDKNYNGYKFEAQTGVSERGDGQEYRIGIAGGTKLFDGRGHIEGSYEYYNSPGIFSKLRRDFGRQVWTVQGAGTTANPYRLVENTRLSSTSFYGLIKSGPLNGLQFKQNGVLSPFVHGTATGGNGVESGGDGAYYYDASLLSLFQSDQAFSRFDYDVSDNVHFYAEVTGMLTHNMNNHQTNELPRSTVMSATNPFLAADYQATMAAAKVSTFTFTKMFQDADPLQPETYTSDYVINTGLNGDIANYKWEVSFEHTKNEQRTRNNHNIDNQRLSAALDAVRAPNGQIVCNVTLTNPGLYPGCVPLNVFGPTAESADAFNYIFKKTTYKAQTQMDNVGASIAGSPFSTWAGPVQVALSGEWRKLQYQLNSNAQPAPANCTGLRYNCSGSTLQYISDVLASRTPVSQTVKEVAVEADVPLLKDVAFAQSFNLNGAARYTDYDTSGAVSTWKLGFDWNVNDQVTFRGTRSRDIRAPNINELFAPVRIVPAGVTDVHTNIVGQAPFITNSNPNLVPEVAKTWTAGVVLRPSFIPRFSLAVDWYKINIGNAITTIQGQNPTIQNICEASNGTSEYCALILRPLPFSDRSAANFVTGFLSQPRNAQTVNTHGVDFEANYAVDNVGPGNLNLRLLAAYQPELLTLQFPGAPTLNSADTAGSATWRVTGFLKYTVGNFTLDVQERWRRSTTWNSDRSLIYAEGRIPAAAYTNATLTYRLDGKEYFFAIRNLFDKQPAPYAVNGGSSGVPGLQGGYSPGDDILGRYFNVGFKMRH